jgi:hypothetical protein
MIADDFDLPAFIEDIAQRPKEHQDHLLAGFLRLQEGSDRQRGWGLWPAEVYGHVLRIDEATPEAYDEMLHDLLIAAYPGDSIDSTQNQ